MASTGKVTGTITVGSAALTEISLAIAPETEEVNNHIRQKQIVAAAAAVTFDESNIGNICFIWFKAVKSSDGTTPLPLLVEVKIGAGWKSMGSVSEFLLVVNPKASATITSVKVTGDASDAAVIEYILAGDA